MDHFEPAKSVNDCLGKCKNTDGCQWFSYITDSRVCFLFKDCPVLDETFEGSSTGQVDCEQGNKRHLRQIAGFNNVQTVYLLLCQRPYAIMLKAPVPSITELFFKQH
jgi:hypothetical protein